MLFAHIQKYNDDFDHPRLVFNETLKKVNPQSSKKNFQNIMSRLVANIEDYMIEDELLQSEHERKILLLKAFNRRSLFRDQNTETERTRRQILESKEDIWNRLYLLQVNFHHFFSDNPIKYKKGIDLIEEMYFLNDKLYQDITLVNQIAQNHFGKIINKENWNKKEVSSYNELDITDWLHAIKEMVIHKDMITFMEFYRLIGKYKNEVNDTSLSIGINTAANICAKLINEGNDQLQSELLQLHMIGLESGAYLIHGEIPSSRLKNIVNVACVMDKFDLAEHIIDTYGPQIVSSERASGIRIAKAELAIQRGELEEALSLMNEIKPTRIILKATQRLIILKAELLSPHDDLEFPNTIIKNHFAFLNNNKEKLSEAFITSSKNLTKILKMIIYKEDPEIIYSKLSEMKIVRNRLWLKKIIKLRLP